MDGIRVVFQGRAYGPILSDDISACGLFSLLEADGLKYQLLNIEGATIPVDETMLSPGIYEITPRLLPNEHANNARLNMKQERFHELALLRKNLNRIVLECRQISKTFRYNPEKYRPMALDTLKELRNISSILETTFADEDHLRWVSQCMIVEFYDILSDKPPFYGRVKSTYGSSHLKQSHFDTIKFRPLNSSQIRHAKINYIKNIIETGTTRESEWLNLLDVSLKAETYRQEGLNGTSKCHGKFNQFQPDVVSQKIKKDFRLKTEKK